MNIHLFKIISSLLKFKNQGVHMALLSNVFLLCFILLIAVTFFMQTNRMQMQFMCVECVYITRTTWNKPSATSSMFYDLRQTIRRQWTFTKYVSIFQCMHNAVVYWKMLCERRDSKNVVNYVLYCLMYWQFCRQILKCSEDGV